MLTKTISADDALSLSEKQEDHFFDRKAAAIKGAKLQKIAVAVAFANADGGEALVGIADDKDEPDPQNRWHGASHITAEGPKAMAYPPETLWEIVVNAIIHRDYSTSDDVQVQIFDNRIEVLSPGRLPAFVTKENILDVRYARNPRIVGMLSRYKNPPNKDIGEGLNTAFQKMKEWRLRSPDVLDEGNYARVVIPHASLATPQEAVLQFLRKHGTITNRQARDITGIKSENAVKSEFYKLRDAGLIEMIPELRGSKAAWRLISGG